MASLLDELTLHSVIHSAFPFRGQPQERGEGEGSQLSWAIVLVQALNRPSHRVMPFIFKHTHLLSPVASEGGVLCALVWDPGNLGEGLRWGWRGCGRRHWKLVVHSSGHLSF